MGHRGCHGNELPKWINAYWLSNNVAIEASWESPGQPEKCYFCFIALGFLGSIT